MLSVEQVKKLINDPTLSHRELEEIRDALREGAELVFEAWQAERKRKGIKRSNRAPGKLQ